MLESIKLSNVRCFKDVSFEFSDSVNLIIGKNGTGKTTLIESIGLFAFGKYQSVSRDTQAIGPGGDVARVEVRTDSSRVAGKISLLQNGEKIIKIADKKVPKSEVVGFVRAILFNPQTIEIVFGSPQTRRRELDIALAQKEGGYLRLLLEYRQIIKQRNNLLKQIARRSSRRSELEFWDSRLIRSAVEIYKKRLKLVSILNSQLGAFHQHLVGRESELMLLYRPSCQYDKFEQEIVARLDEDIRFGQTTIGPHRDDFDFVEKEFLLKNGASRGEQRMASIAFKVAMKEAFTKDASTPILLLDDVFSELDEKRRESVAGFLGDLQTFISATDDKVVPESLKKKAKVFEI